MKRKQWEQNLTTETKKEFIIRIAKEDPFLKIEEISELANTTPRYVRTILSEANLSLMNLREEYARKIEKSIEFKTLILLKDSVSPVNFPPGELNKVYFTYGQFRYQQLEDLSHYTWNVEKVPLYQYVQSIYHQGRILAILVLVTSINLVRQLTEQQHSLLSYVPNLTGDGARLADSEIETCQLSEYLPEEIFKNEFGSDLTTIKITTHIGIDEKVVAEESYFIPGNGVKLKIAGLFNPSLKQVNKA